MKVKKCYKCESTRIKIEFEESCDNCENNGFTIDEELAVEIGIEPKKYNCEFFYDQELLEKAEAKLGHEIERDEAYECGVCKAGDVGGDGCWIFSCHDCGARIDMVPKVSC